MAKQAAKRRKVKATPLKTSRTRKPSGISLEEWQVKLRREFGREQSFTCKNLGQEPVFSEYAVTNPKSGRTYRVAIRGKNLGESFCSCPDFRVNTLGTCKHIEWLLGKIERQRGGKQALKEGFHPAYSEVCLHYGLFRRVRWRPAPECPPALRETAGRFFDKDGWLRESAIGKFQDFVREASASDHEVRIYDDALEFVARMRDDAHRRKQVAKEYGNGDAAWDKLLKVKLYPYQRTGALFAAQAGRCLIADDMGLGKTIQAVAAVEILARTVGLERVLVVCPTSLKHQWAQEIERFAGRTAMVVEGTKPVRRGLYREESLFKITNYDVVHRDLGDIGDWRPDLVILDEAQRIKNWETIRAKAVKQIDTNYAIVLTGTPLENRLAELHSIMEFVDRFHLGPLFRFLHEHQETDRDGRIVGYRRLDHIKESLASVLIRRRKSEVLLELPERTDKHYFVEMTPAQWEIHEEQKRIIALIIQKWKRWGFLTEADQRRLMVALQMMRMSCNSTYLIDKETDHGPKMDECCILLDDILAIPENKVVIFSQWLGTHEMLIRRLDAEQRPYAYYHGSLQAKERKKVLDRFRNDPECRILLCTDSGGVGLNLQFASVLINMDQPWNPAVLEQRVGRIHRLGQHRHVQVHHFVSRSTIEHGMLGVLKFKASLFAGVLDGGESEVFLGGSKMKKFMETVEQVSESIPANVPTPAEAAEAASAALDAEQPAAAEEEAPVAAASPQEQAWGELLNVGMSLISQFGKALQEGGAERKVSAPPLAALVKRDESTGAPELRIPMPDAETANKLGALLTGLGQAIQAWGKK